MLFEIEKAFDSLRHPGIKTNLYKLARNAVPYYLSTDLNVSAPITVYWSINSICNLRCKMCDVGMNNTETTFWKNLRIEKKLKEVDIRVFKSVIDEIAADKPFIAINSTEPLMYKPIVEAISYCTQKGLESAITTGGYTLPALAEDLAKAGLSRLNVSVDGPREIHNFIRGREDSFERSLKGIEKFIEVSKAHGLKNEVFVNYTISNMNFDKVLEFSKLAEQLPVTINFVQMWYVDQAMADEHNAHFGSEYPATVACLSEYNDPTKVDVDVLYNQMEVLAHKKNIHFLPKLNRQQLEQHYHQTQTHMKSNSRCMAAQFFVNILADGTVIPFTRCPSMNLGNINDSSFKSIWNGPKMKGWRAFIKQQKKMPMCRKCDVIY